MNRRNFIGRALSAIGGVLAIPFIGKATEPDYSDIRYWVKRSELGPRTPIIVTGPTPEYLIKGVKGETYANVSYQPWKCWSCKLDGVTVDMRCSEADSVAGWVRMFDANEDGTIKVYRPMIAQDGLPHTIQRIHFGHVELSYTCSTPEERAISFIEVWGIAIDDPCSVPSRFTTHDGRLDMNEGELLEKCLMEEVDTGIVMDMLRRRFYAGVKPIPWADAAPGVTIDFIPVQQLQ